MANQSSIFPIFLRAEYREDPNGIPQFISRIQQAAKISEAEMKRVGAALNSALSSPRTSGGALDLGTAQLREQIRAAEQAAMAAREVQQATLAAASASGTFNAAFTPTINAYRDAAKASEANAAALRAQLAALEAVQAELNQTASATSVLTGENLRLAQAEAGAANGAAMLAAIYRGTAAELGRVANSARESASAFELLFQAQDARASSAAQAFFNTALGIDRQTKSARDSARAFEELFAAQERAQVAARRITSDFLALAQAEAAAVNGANMIAATLRGTALEADRTANSARESARVFEEMFERQAQAAREAQAAQEAYAASLASLRAQINPAAAAQQQFNERVAFAQAALDRGELSQQEYARAVQLASAALRQAGQAEVAAAAARNGLTAATNAGTTARGNVINSIRAERTAFTQLGQQLQDVGVQYQQGTSALTIFTQQLPQAAFALTGLADSADRTKRQIGQVATVLSGPLGGAIVIATALLGPFIAKLFETDDAASKAARSVEDLVGEKVKSAAEARNAAVAEDVFARTLDGVTDAVRRNREAIEGLTNAKRSNAEETLRNSRIQLANALAVQFNTQQQIFNAKALLDARLARATGPSQQADLAALGLPEQQARLDNALASLITGAGQIAEIQKQINSASVLVAVERGVEGAEGRIKRQYEAELEGLRKTAAARGLSTDQIEREAAAIKAREQASLDALKPDRKNTSAAATERRRIREAERLAEFGERAAEQIQRINERFDEQPRLIDAAAQATRQLDAIVADLEKRKPLGFEQLVEQAQDAKRTVEDALLRPIQQIRQESEQRLQIEEALAVGQTDRAAALQEIFRLEQQIGTLNEDQRGEIEGIVIAEQRRLRVLRDQQAVFNAQLDVLDTVRRDLTDLLSGRSADFFGNFRQALQDLQGQRLFEAIFGDAFRAIEDELQKNTPQGRANAAYVREVDKTVQTTSRLEGALDGLTSSIEGASGRISGRNLGAAANDNGGFNPQFAMAEAALSAIGQGNILVRGQKPETDLSRRSTIDLAKMISTSIGESIGAELEGIFGERFATIFGEVAGGIIAGKVVGGTPGAVLGGLGGILKGMEGLEEVSKIFDKLVEGTARGTQVAGLSKALGLGGSTTGAQVGGFLGQGLGTLIGGPVGGKIGSFIGAIGGNFIGSLLKGTPRGSATIGGTGGSLGVTSVVGNKSALREAASGLAGNVLEAINDIADQLGASVNAGAGTVSIGQRKGNLRVDPRGGGATKLSNGAINFGEDTEAAVAFAVRDLIQDGVIEGLRQSEQNLLRAGDDIEAAINDVLKFRSVFDQLDERRDPVGAAVRGLNREFEDLIELFDRAGATAEEFADLEELYNIRRAEAIEEANERISGSLRQLLDDLRTGDNGLSLRDRQANAVGRFNSLAGRVAAGDTSAFDDFAEVSQQLLEIERSLFGSTQSYFDRLNQITALTERAVADQTNVTSIAAGAPSPFDERQSVNRAIDNQTSELASRLDAINQNLIALGGVQSISPASARGGMISPRRIANF